MSLHPPRRQYPAELATPLVTLAVVVSLLRLFTTNALAGRLLLTAVAAHVACVAVRRLSGNKPGLVLGNVLVAPVWVSAVFLWQHTWLGLPTISSLSAGRAAVRGAFAGVSDQVAPISPTVGHGIVLALLIWLLAIFLDHATFGAAAPIQGVIPHLTVFAATAVLALGRGAVASSAAILIAVTAHLVANHIRLVPAASWVPEPRRGLRLQLRATLGFTAAGLLVTTAVLAPVLHDGMPRLDLRRMGRDDGSAGGFSATGLSIRSLLGPQGNATQFDVVAAAPHYWRLTSYIHAGDSWEPPRIDDLMAQGEVQPLTDGPLGPGGAPPGSATWARFRLQGLNTEWLPSIQTPTRAVNATGGLIQPGLYYDSDRSAIVAPSRTASGMDYLVEASVPNPDSTGSAHAPPPPGDGLPAPAREWLAETIRGVAPGSDQLRAVQDRLRSFTYDAGVNFSAAGDPLSEFLRARRGFCVQFSDAMVRFAEQLGFPARVAVGFLPGQPTPLPDGTQRFSVRGKDAHAWPEIVLQPGGPWVAFEPTPGRANPDTVRATGVPPTTPTTTTAVPTTLVNQSSTTLPPAAPTAPPSATTTNGRSGQWLPWLGVAVALVVASATAVWLLRRRARAAADAVRRITDAWSRATAALETAGMADSAPLTPHEVARSAAELDLDDATLTAVQELAELESDRRYAAPLSGPAGAEHARRAADRAEQAANQVVHVLRGRTSRRHTVTPSH
jgi:transglutaminase-like putative cysteine protease